MASNVWIYVIVVIILSTTAVFLWYWWYGGIRISHQWQTEIVIWRANDVNVTLVIHSGHAICGGGLYNAVIDMCIDS
jgi:hypothetical protein